MATQVVCAGVPAAATYFIAKDNARWRGIASHLGLVAGVQVVLAIVIMGGLVEYFLGDKGAASQTAGLLAIASVPFLIAQYYGLAILQGLGDIQAFNIYRVAPPAVYTVTLLGGLYFGLTLVACTAMWVGSLVATTIAIVAALARRSHSAGGQAITDSDVPTRREVIRFGVAGFVAQVSPIETFRVDQLMTAVFFPSQIVGYYAVASSVSNVPRFIADGIVAVGYPHVSGLEPSQGRESSKRYLLAASVMCGGSAVAIAVALPWLIPQLFGSRFSPASSIGILLIISAGLISVRRVALDCLRALGKPAATTVNEFITWLILVPAFLTVGRWGAGRGIAVALVIAASVGLSLVIPFFRRSGPARS